MVKIKLKRFDFSLVPRDGRIILVIGRRGSGKSTLLEDIMFRFSERLQDGFVLGMSPTQNSIDMMERHMPRALIFEEGFSKETFAKLLSLAALIARKKKMRKGLLVMDDCNADKDAFRGKVMRDAFYNGRQYDLNILWAMHYCMDILPDLRTNVDFVFVLKENIRKNKERLYNNFFGMFEKPDDFFRVMDQCTENNECLVLDNTAPNSDPSQCLYWYKAKKAEDLPKFCLGKPIFFNLSRYYCKEDDDNGHEMLQVRIRPGQDHAGNDLCRAGKLPFANANNPRIEYVEKAGND
jgi:energy-coupling factor transporter ATP-binding protein EcfA2